MSNELKPGVLLDKWRYFLKDIISPNAFIDMGFYYMINAALQRRVWTGSNLMPLFPNMYVILVGPPGTGKGLVLGQVSNILKYHKYVNPVKTEQPAEPTTSKGVDPFAKMFEKKPEQQISNNKYDSMLIPVAADATTYEKLVQVMAKTTRKVTYTEIVDGSPQKKYYVYKSLCFCLEEISSLFAKNTDKVVAFLLNAFDCKDYDYETKHQGEDLLRKPCLNLLGGTTPSFMQQTFDSKLIGDGFSARTIFVYENYSRSHRFGTIEFCKEQLDARMAIIDHIKIIANLFGHIKFSKHETPEAWAIMQKYFEEEMPNVRQNYNPKLEPYYQRKNIHAIKLAMAVHFSYSTDMELFPQDCEMALTILNELEKKMHMALNFGRNPLGPIMKSIVKYLTDVGTPKTFEELWEEHIADAQEMEMQEALRALMSTGKIIFDSTLKKYGTPLTKREMQIELVKEALERSKRMGTNV